jgi:quercetin dioxygenase-like cupin family protein
MKEIKDMRIPVVFVGLFVAGCVSVAVAQDPVKVDPAHYKVISENDQVRVLHVHYGPHQKSVMHGHPDGVIVFLSGGKVKFSYPDGKTEIIEMKPGEARYTPHTVHLPENESDQAMEAVLVELKK